MYASRNSIQNLLGGIYSQSASTYVQTTTPSPTSIIAPSASLPPQNSVVSVKSNATKGNFLVAMNDMTLYVFDKDKPGVSNCTGSCLAIWPPYTVSTENTAKLPSEVGTIKRADGSMQYTWNKWPLYYYASDIYPGDVNGDGVGGIWHLVKP